MAQCIWCNRAFTPRTHGRNTYQLLHAGETICWNCADRFESEEIRLHMDQLEARYVKNRAHTENGYALPLIFTEWKSSYSPRTRKVAYATDSFGRKWTAKLQNDNLIKLRPTGVYRKEPDMPG